MQGKIKQRRLNELDRYVSSPRSLQARRRADAWILAFSRRQTLSPTLTDVNRLIKSIGHSVVAVRFGRIAPTRTEGCQRRLDYRLIPAV